MQRCNGRHNVFRKSVNHWWFIDFIAWRYFTPMIILIVQFYRPGKHENEHHNTFFDTIIFRTLCLSKYMTTFEFMDLS